jgi:uncharacterized phiE125 gp8 family phage protein
VGVTLITPAAETPVSLAVARQHVSVAGTARDDLLAIYLAAATERVERFTGRALVDSTWDLTLDEFPADGAAIELPNPPLIEVVGVFYQDDDGLETEVDAADYIVGESIGQPARVLPTSGSWPTAGDRPNAVRVRFRAGYLDATTSPAVANVPSAIKAAVLLLTGDLYAHRETLVVGDTAAEMPGYLDAFLRPYRVRLGMA